MTATPSVHPATSAPSAPARRRRALWLAAPAAVPTLLVLAGSVGAALLQSLGLAPLAGQPELSADAWTAAGPALLQAAGVSFYVAAASTVLSCGIGFAAAAFILSSPRFGRGIAALGAATIPIPHLIGAGAIGLLLSDAGFLARLFGLSDGGFPRFVGSELWGAAILEYAWKESAFVALVIVGSLSRNWRGLYDVAATLGATGRQRLVRVMFPMALPALAISALIVFIYTLGSFEALWLLGPTSPEPLPVMAVRLFSSIDLAARPQAMAAAVVAVGIGTAAIVAGVLLLKRLRTLR